MHGQQTINTSQSITAITNYIHCVVLLTKATHHIASHYESQKLVMFTKTKQWTLF